MTAHFTSMHSARPTAKKVVAEEVVWVKLFNNNFSMGNNSFRRAITLHE